MGQCFARGEHDIKLTNMRWRFFWRTTVQLREEFCTLKGARNATIRSLRRLFAQLILQEGNIQHLKEQPCVPPQASQDDKDTEQIHRRGILRSHVKKTHLPKEPGNNNLHQGECRWRDSGVGQERRVPNQAEDACAMPHWRNMDHWRSPGVGSTPLRLSCCQILSPELFACTQVSTRGGGTCTSGRNARYSH